MQARNIWFKGSIVPVEQANISVLSPTAQFGLNVFEGIRCYASGGGNASLVADPTWLTYLVRAMIEQNADAIGGPNITPASDHWLARCVSVSPGNPCHVMINDRDAEHGLDDRAGRRQRGIAARRDVRLHRHRDVGQDACPVTGEWKVDGCPCRPLRPTAGQAGLEIDGIQDKGKHRTLSG